MSRCRNTRPTNAMVVSRVNNVCLHLWVLTPPYQASLPSRAAYRRAQSTEVRLPLPTPPSSLTPSTTHQRVSGYASPVTHAFAFALLTACRQRRPRLRHAVPPIPRRHPHRAAARARATHPFYTAPPSLPPNEFPNPGANGYGAAGRVPPPRAARAEGTSRAFPAVPRVLISLPPFRSNASDDARPRCV